MDRTRIGHGNGRGSDVELTYVRNSFYLPVTEIHARDEGCGSGLSRNVDCRKRKRSNRMREK
jgi:hypothetical protein